MENILLVDGVERVVNMEPSPHDNRDWIFENLQRGIRFRSNILDLRKYLNKPRNQGSRGTCVAFTVSTIKEYQERIDVGFTGYMSPESVYFYREVSTGMYFRNAMKILHKKGISPELYFPYGNTEPVNIPKQALDSMEHYKIKNYARVTTIDGAKKALGTYGPLLLGVPVYNNSPQIWKPANENDKLTGGHAMTIVGYNKTGFIVRNSWGSKWNGDGHVIFPYEDWGLHWEVWSSIDAESPSLPPELMEKSWWKCF